MEFDLLFFASLLLMGLIVFSGAAALVRLRFVASNSVPANRLSFTSAPMLLCFGIGALGSGELFWLIFTHIELPEMVNGSLTAESIAKRTMTAQWGVRGAEFVGWILILFGFLKIKRPESPA